MNNANRQLPPQVSASLRFAAAAGVCAFLAIAWTAAEHASRYAVRTDIVAFSNGPAHGAQTVQVAARKVASARRS